MIRLIFLILIIATLSACVSPRQQISNRIMSDQTVDTNVKAAIARKEILVGMSKDEVLAAWGFPTGSRTSSNGGAVFIYDRDYGSFYARQHHVDYVFFGPDYRVTSWDLSR